MVVVHRARGYRFVIYTQDHAPAHLHLVGEGQAKVNLLGREGGPELVYSVGVGRPELRRLMAEVDARQGEFLAHWERIHGTPQRG